MAAPQLLALDSHFFCAKEDTRLRSLKCSIARSVVRLAPCAVTVFGRWGCYAFAPHRVQAIGIVLVQTQSVALHLTGRKPSSGTIE
jgi:hypothetical protein